VLEWGDEHGYPFLRYANESVAYACDQGLFHWLVTVLCGTDDYVRGMMLAIETAEREHGPPWRSATDYSSIPTVVDGRRESIGVYNGKVAWVLGAHVANMTRPHSRQTRAVDSLQTNDANL